MAHPAFRQPLGNTARIVHGATGALVGTIDELKERANMARLEGTGKDPLGRYGKGEIFDVPKEITSGGVTQVNPTYQEILDKGWAKEVKPEDDPGRTLSQIANAKVVDPNATLANPVDAKIADSLSEQEALSIVHTGTDKDALDGDLKTDAIREGQSDDRLQRQPSPRFLGDDKPEAAQEAEATADANSTDASRQAKASGSGSSSSSSSSGS